MLSHHDTAEISEKSFPLNYKQNKNIQYKQHIKKILTSKTMKSTIYSPTQCRIHF